MGIALRRRAAAHDEAHRRDGEGVAVGSMDIKRRAASHRAVDAHQPGGALRHQPTRPVTVDSDASCPAPAVYRAVVGLRYISNLSALDSGCSAPQLSEPECYYYVPLYSGVASGRLHPANNGPPSSGWAGASGDYMVTLAGAPTSPDVALTFQHYVDVAGGPCLLASTYCRAEVTTIRRRAADFNSSAMPPLQFVVDDFRVNRDQTPSGGNLPWVDHVVPQTAYFAGDQLAVTWLDFRADPVYDVAYQFVTNDLRLDGARSGWDIWSVLESRETFWGQTGTYQQQCLTRASVRFGDSYHPARAELHGHFFVPRMVPGTTSPTIEQWVAIRSPQNPQD